jgi:ATP-dependent DNA ligase
MTRSSADKCPTQATALPGWVKPQLTKLVDQPPDGPEWLHEIKFDGYRMHARLDRGAIRLLTRAGLDWTHKYPAIASAVASLPARQAYLDGELCGVRPDGTTSFSLIQNASDTGNGDALVFFLFDDPAVAASQFNWLIMGEPLNRAMLLGDKAIPKPAELRRHAAAGVRMFLASYGK